MGRSAPGGYAEPASSLRAGQRATAAVITTGPDLGRRQRECLRDDLLHRRPRLPQRLARGGRVIAIRHRQSGQAMAAFLQCGQHIGRMPVLRLRWWLALRIHHSKLLILSREFICGKYRSSFQNGRKGAGLSSKSVQTLIGSLKYVTCEKG